MLAVLHDRHGDPAQVLRTGSVSAPDPSALPPGSALVEVALTPIHPGDLQSVAGSPTFGDLVEIPEGGRTPGVEGVGTVLALAPDVASGPGVGDRVMFFPGPGAWAGQAVVPAGGLVGLPDEIPDEVAAHVLVDAATAAMVVRAGHEAVAARGLARPGLTVLQTGAGSAVGRLITADLLRRGVRPIRLVRTAASARRLVDRLPGAPVVATEAQGWGREVSALLDGTPVPLAFDGVGGPLLGEVTRLLGAGGTVVNYGALGGAGADIRWFVPRRATLTGVSVLSWLGEPEQVRQDDVATALDVARRTPELFTPAAVFAPEDIAEAVAAVERPGRDGAVLLDFRGRS